MNIHWTKHSRQDKFKKGFKNFASSHKKGWLKTQDQNNLVKFKNFISLFETRNCEGNHKTFSEKALLIHHFFIHTIEKPYKCATRLLI
ncbi:hypothetical protein JTE90_009810 [Oedothorax gibbosus]|uniref:C2H2-type domain-containing protein n=1 Tax=Oedothorax gibbosus TaxID=931172 RepID=A0AAV6UR10_9ARAC|nr:hypothetical protein JTE90_009810 [Oedothorax gibbosus]